MMLVPRSKLTLNLLLFHSIPERGVTVLVEEEVLMVSRSFSNEYSFSIPSKSKVFNFLIVLSNLTFVPTLT